MVSLFYPRDPRRPMTIYTRFTRNDGAVKIFRRVFYEATFIKGAKEYVKQTGQTIHHKIIGRIFDTKLDGITKSGLTYIQYPEWIAKGRKAESSFKNKILIDLNGYLLVDKNNKILSVKEAKSIDKALDGYWSVNIVSGQESYIASYELDFEFKGNTEDGWYLGSTPEQSNTLANNAIQTAFVNMATRFNNVYPIRDSLPIEYNKGVTTFRDHVTIKIT